VFEIDPASPDEVMLETVSRHLLEGDLVAAPSDTVYGLLALPRSEIAREKLTRVKGRDRPFIVLVTRWEEARSWTREVPEVVWERLREVWPGPVTVILPTSSRMPGSSEGGIGIRMPDSVLLTRLLQRVGEPLFSTSANVPGEAPPIRADEIAAAVTAEVAFVLDAGVSDSREPSTIVDLAHGNPSLIREGRGDAGVLLDPKLASF
jgi:L-threonylcarbamoyladenylate synthase